jgi:hypothetical protein
MSAFMGGGGQKGQQKSQKSAVARSFSNDESTLENISELHWQTAGTF